VIKYISALVIGVLFVASTPSIALAQGRLDIAEKRQQARALAEEARENAQPPKPDVEERKATIQQQVEERRSAVQQDVCERRQQNLARVMPRLATGATTVKSTIDTVFERVKGFYESNQLTVENYEDHLNSIETAKVNAEAALEVVSEYRFELDCENQNVGEQLAAYRESIAAARDSLKVYRGALVNLISDMRAEAAQDQTEEEPVNAETEEESTDEQ